MQRESFLQFVEKVRSFGFRVYLNRLPEHGNYAVFTDGKRIGKMRETRLDTPGVIFSTVHRGGAKFGEGFALQTEYESVPLQALTKRHVTAAFSLVSAKWDMPFVRDAIRKYKDFQEWKDEDIFARNYDITD